MGHWRSIREDLAQTASRAAGDLELHRAFVEKNGVTEWAFVPWRGDYLPYILRAGRFPAGHRRYPLEGFDHGPPPGLDHGRLYRGRDGVLLAYHPYGLTDAEQERLLDWCQEAGTISLVLPRERSWYNPGRTLLVIVTAGGVKF